MKTKKKTKTKTKKQSRKQSIVSHKPLGDINNIPLIIKQFNESYNKLNITFNTNKKYKPQIEAITAPHAGFIYSGIIALYAIKELLEANKTAKTITILWFRHNKERNEEHSMINIKYLVKLLKPSKMKIKTIEINNTTKLNTLLKLKPPFIASTDFAHYNYGTPAQNLIEAWENDKPFLTMRNKNNLPLLVSNKSPCGSQPLRIMKEWSAKKGNKLHLLGYSNSKYKEKWWLKDSQSFNGVTYASLGSIMKASVNWFSLLNSKILAYSHLGWIKDCLLSNNNTFADNNGLFWSPLQSMKGSCFLTVYRENKDTYSCFGAWEEQSSSLLDNIIKATKTVKRASWGSNKPVTRNVLQTHLKGNYSLSLTLIEPQEKWVLVGNKSLERNRGYVYCHRKTKQIGMTYLPSVWTQIPDEKEFIKNLKQKHKRVYSDNPQEWVLYKYDSLSWGC